MKNVSLEIEKLGFNKWFFDRIDPAKLIDHQIARVITVDKDSYTINNGNGDVSAEVTGKLKITEIHALIPGIRVVPFSNKDNARLKPVKELLVPRKTYCLLGSSGVGKTTLINNLLDEVRLKTHSVRKKDGKGRHITTRRQLIKLKNEKIKSSANMLNPS